MTVREFIQDILIVAPDLDAIVYISRNINGNTGESESFNIDEITSWGSNDMIDIVIHKWEEQ